MLPQWHDELPARFGREFTILEHDYLIRVHREHGYGVNPWGTPTPFIILHHPFLGENYARSLRD